MTLISCASARSPISALGNSDDESDLVESDTHWEDNITSFVRTGHFRITQKITVQRIEYLTQLPSILPIFRTPTAIVIDMSGPEFDIVNPKTGDFIPCDTLVRDAVRPLCS